MGTLVNIIVKVSGVMFVAAFAGISAAAMMRGYDAPPEIQAIFGLGGAVGAIFYCLLAVD